MTGEAAFWDRTADKYAAQPVADQAAYEHKLAETRKRLSPDMHLFEFGCGTGTTALIHAPHVATVKAIDISPRMIEICREKAAAQGVDNASFAAGTLETVTDAPASYDAVLGMSILHLLRDRTAALKTVHRLLKPGGSFFSSTACIKDSNPLIRIALPVLKLIGFAPYVGAFTSDELVAELEQAGFEIELRWQPGPGKSVFIIARKP